MEDLLSKCCEELQVKPLLLSTSALITTDAQQTLRSESYCTTYVVTSDLF